MTVDAKLQIWDLSVSSLDPVVTLDIGAEDKEDEESADKDKDAKENSSPLDLGHTLPSSPALGATRYDRFDHNKEEEKLTPMNKLLRNLSNEPKRRVLTSVLFGEKNPVVVVGDNKGNVNVYRVFDPLTINHLGPLQQFQKLKEAVLRQTDPAIASSLQQEGMKAVETK